MVPLSREPMVVLHKLEAKLNSNATNGSWYGFAGLVGSVGVATDFCE